MLPPLDDHIQKELNAHLKRIEDSLDADVLSIIGPILPPLDIRVRDVVETLASKKPRLAIVLDTLGGTVEVVERISDTIRHHYSEVFFLIPNRAMSAGTILVMSGDRIFMDYFSCLGPIDPQIVRDEQLVPAQSYIHKFKELNEKAQKGELTAAEYGLLSKFDLGELDQFEQARELSIELIEKWLTNYKFKNWIKTETRQDQVTPELKQERAKAIADLLSDYTRWHSHGRGINMETLRNEVKLKIEDFSSFPGLEKAIHDYYGLLRDYMDRNKFNTFLHTREFF